MDLNNNMYKCKECDNQYDLALKKCPVCQTPAVEEYQAGEELQAIAAITAEFITVAGGSKIQTRVGNLWPIQNDICRSFITKIEQKFKNKNKFHSYYDEMTSINSTPSQLLAYISKNVTFEQLVANLMNGLKSAAIDIGVHKVAGGNIVFMHYVNSETDDLGRMLAIMVNNKDGFNFDDELIPTDVKLINIDALRQAAYFDLNLFESTYPNKPLNDTYLRFIEGNSKGEFFKKAFGCEVKADNTRSKEQLFDAIEKFQETNGLSNRFYYSALEKVDAKFAKAAKDRKPVSLNELASIIESQLPSGSTLQGTFASFVNNNNFEVNDFIEPTNFAVEADKWVDVKADDESFKAKVYRTKVGSLGSGSPVEFDEKNNKLILVVRDPETRNALKKLVSKDD